MKKAFLFIALAVCGTALADSYNTVLHARISPTNRVVTSIPTWAQSDTPPSSGGVDTNAVKDLVNDSFEGGTQKVNRVTGSFDDLSDRVASIEGKEAGWDAKQDALPFTVTTNIVGTVTNVVTNFTINVDYATDASQADGARYIKSANGLSTIHADGRWVTRTNATEGVEETNYLCTVAAAKAKADAAEAAAKGYTDEKTSDETLVRWDAEYERLKHGGTTVTAENVMALSIVWPEDSTQTFAGKAANAGLADEAISASYLKADIGLAGGEIQYDWDSERWRSVLADSSKKTLAYTSELPTPDDDAFKAAFAPKTATETALANLSTTSATHTEAIAATEATVATWEDYWRGDRVRLSVTNYYGNTSGEPPRLRIEEFDHSVTNGGVVSNFYRVVWDELTRQTSYYARVESQMGTLSNRVLSAAWQQTNLQLANKAPRAWQSVTSAGEDAPPNTVWHTAPSTVFAGGTEYAHVAVGEGQICVLVDKGAPVYTEGAEGQFRFCDETRQNYFGFDVRSAYTIGCRTDGIAVDYSTHIVSLTYDLTSASPPSILHSTNLVDWVDVEATWELDPPPGAQICYFNAGAIPHGFFKAEMRHAGGSKFLTNMMADMIGGIAATNETGVSTATQLPIYPAITPTGIVWRVMQ